MTTSDVEVGDEVKNGRSSAWGKVVALDVDVITGRVRRLRVRKRLGPAFQHEPVWWLAKSITMLERKSCP